MTPDQPRQPGQGWPAGTAASDPAESVRTEPAHGVTLEPPATPAADPAACPLPAHDADGDSPTGAASSVGPSPAEGMTSAVPVTGDAAVDAVLAELAQASTGSLDDQVESAGRLERVLNDRLGDIDLG